MELRSEHTDYIAANDCIRNSDSFLLKIYFVLLSMKTLDDVLRHVSGGRGLSSWQRCQFSLILIQSLGKNTLPLQSLLADSLLLKH